MSTYLEETRVAIAQYVNTKAALSYPNLLIHYENNVFKQPVNEAWATLMIEPGMVMTKAITFPKKFLRHNDKVLITVLVPENKGTKLLNEITGFFQSLLTHKQLRINADTTLVFHSPVLGKVGQVQSYYIMTIEAPFHGDECVDFVAI